MTVVLIAVYVPIGFQGGLTGALFTEFAFTLVGAVTVSAIIALTLSPMMTSRLLRPHSPGARDWESRLVAFIDRGFGAAASPLPALAARQPELSAGHRDLRADHPGQHLFLLHRFEDRAGAAGRPGRDHHRPPPRHRIRRWRSACCTTGRCIEAFASFPETAHVFQLDVPGQDISGMVMKPWDQRTRTADVLQPIVQQTLGKHRRPAHRGVPATAAAGRQSACRCSSSSAPPSRSSS